MSVSIESVWIDLTMVEGRSLSEVLPCDAVIFVFNTAARSSFEHLMTYRHSLGLRGDRPIAVIGAMLDRGLQVTPVEGLNLATTLGANGPSIPA